MASLLEYLQQRNAELDAQKEAIAQNLAGVQKSKDVLAALGQPVEPKKPGRSIMSRVGGALSGLVKVIDTPGRLVRVGLGEAMGLDTPDLAGTSGWDEFKKALKGDINVSGADLTGLKSNEKDAWWKKLGKGVVNVGTEIALDPTTWLGNPSALLRSTGQEALVTLATKGDLLEKVVANSAKGINVVGDLNKASDTARAASIVENVSNAARTAEAAKAAEAATTGAEFVARSADDIAAEAANEVARVQLGKQLADAYRTGGRSGLRKELETLTGSKIHAKSLFKELPDDIRGGIVLQTPWGKTITRDGKAIRFAGGTGAGLGPVTDALNSGRVALGYFTNSKTRFLKGATGNMLADVKKVDYLAMRGKDVPEALKSASIVDYVTAKNAPRYAKAELVAVQKKLVATNREIEKSVKQMTSPEDVEAFKEAFTLHYHNPGLAIADEASPAYQAGVEAASQARRDFAEFDEIRKKSGLDIGSIGSAEEYSPLFLTPEAHERMVKDGLATSGGNVYDMKRGRDAYIDLTGGVESGVDVPMNGWIDPKTGKKYMNPIAINDKLEKDAIEEALAAGKSAEEAAQIGKEARKFVEDPTEIINKYGLYVGRKASGKRLVDTLAATGTLVRDIPEVRKVIDTFTRDSAMLAMKGLDEPIREALKRRASAAEEQLRSVLAPETLAEQRAKVDEAAAALRRDVETKTSRVEDLRRQVAEASDEVAANEPSIQGLRAELGSTRAAADTAAVNLDASSRAAKNANDRLREARKALGKDANEKAVIERAMSMPDIPADEFDALNARALELSDSILTREQKIATEQAIKDQAATRTAELRAVRNEAESARAQQIVDRIDRHTEAVAKRDALVAELNAARQERNAARSSLRSVETDVASDQYRALQGIVDDYVTAAREVHMKKGDVLPATATAEEVAANKAAVKELEKAAKEKKKILEKALDFAKKSEYGPEVQDYAKSVIAAAEKLDADELTIALAMADSRRLTTIMDTIESELGSSDAAIRAVDDLYTVFASLRDKLGDEALTGLKPVEERLLDADTLKTIKEGAYKTKTELGAIGRAARREGMVSMEATKNPIFQGFFGSEGLIEAMKTIYKSSANTEGFDKFAAEYLDQFLANWKLGTTTARGPGFLINNLVGGMWNNFVGGVGLNQAARAGKAMNVAGKRAFEEELAKVTETFGGKMSSGALVELAEKNVARKLNSTVINGRGMGDLWLEFKRLGGSEAGDIAATMRAAGIGATKEAPKGKADALFKGTMGFLAENPVQRRMNQLAGDSESFLRFAAFLDGFEKFGDVDAAMSKVHALHFDYADLSGAEKWVKRAVPFYTWTRNNIPLQVRGIITQPGKFNSVMRAQGLINEMAALNGEDSWMDEITPDYLTAKGGFISKLKIGENMIGLTPSLPVNQLSDFITPEGTFNRKSILNLLGPQFKLPVEVATKRNLETGAPDESNVIGKILKGIVPQLAVGQNVLTTVNPLVEKATPVSLPFVQKGKEFQRFTSLTGLPYGVLGLTASTVTPKSLGYGALTRKEELDAQINALAAERNIDPTWIRNQLSKGLEPWMVKILLGAGLGRNKVSSLPQTSELSSNARELALRAMQGSGQ